MGELWAWAGPELCLVFAGDEVGGYGYYSFK